MVTQETKTPKTFFVEWRILLLIWSWNNTFLPLQWISFNLLHMRREKLYHVVENFVFEGKNSCKICCDSAVSIPNLMVTQYCAING